MFHQPSTEGCQVNEFAGAIAQIVLPNTCWYFDAYAYPISGVDLYIV